MRRHLVSRPMLQFEQEINIHRNWEKFEINILCPLVSFQTKFLKDRKSLHQLTNTF